VITERNLIKTAENYDRLWKMRAIFNKLHTKETEMAWDIKLQTMSMYLGRERKFLTAPMTTVCATVSGLTTRIASLGHKPYMDNFFLP
jgi:hypothetical protein